MATLKIWETVRPPADVPAIRLDDRTTYQAVSFTGTAGVSAAFDEDTTLITVQSDANCAVSVGDDPEAVATDYPLPAHTPLDISVLPGQKISVILVGTDWETIAASQTDQAMGATGAAGDYLAGLLIIPATTSPGAVRIEDGSGSAVTVFTGGADSVSNLVPFFVPLDIRSRSGAWEITTGANVSAIAVGLFT